MTARPRDFRTIIQEHLEECPGQSLGDVFSQKDFAERMRFLAGALSGEAGELQNQIKKEWRGDVDVQISSIGRQDWWNKVKGELVDVANYTHMLAEHLGIDHVELHRMQVAKLLEVEERPTWKGKTRVGAHNLDHLHAYDVNDNPLGCVPLHPIDTAAARLLRTVIGKGFWTGTRTSKSTLDVLAQARRLDAVPAENFPEDYTSPLERDGSTDILTFIGRPIRDWSVS